MLGPEDFFDLQKTQFKNLFENAEFVWEGLKNITPYIKKTLSPNVATLRKKGVLLDKTLVLYEGKVLDSGFSVESTDTSKGKLLVKKDGQVLVGASLVYAGVALMDDRISIGKGVVLEPGVLIKGPAIIGDNTEVRQGAYLRGNVLVGDGCVVGHTTEMKNAVMLGGSKAGHFAYIGDSILGRVNLGAGTKLANFKIFESSIILNIAKKSYETSLRKFGAIMADGVETGCNCVTSPGTLLSRNVLLYPNITARGYYPPNTIVKLKQEQVFVERKR